MCYTRYKSEKRWLKAIVVIKTPVRFIASVNAYTTSEVYAIYEMHEIALRRSRCAL
jgi:hypothetical protein